MAFQIDALLFTCRTMGERNVIVGNVFEKVDLIFGKEKAGSN